jgi:hypothetical protein
MAVYHLSAKIVSRGKGHSSVAAAAYQSRSMLIDERTGERHNYSRKSGELLFEGIYAPKDAPDWTHDRAKLWNHVEAFERRSDAQLAKSFDIALPHELTLEQNRFAIQDWVRDNFMRKGLIADVAIHAPGVEGDVRNIHAHVLVVMRKLDGTEFAVKKERAATVEDRKDELEALRASWERIGNRHLERHGFEPTLDRRSLLEQGAQREPSIHLGKDAMALERDGKPTDRGDINRAISAENERRVIDLAAERALRAEREAAKGRTDDIRPDHTPQRDDMAPPASPAPELRDAPERETPAEPDTREPSITPERAAADHEPEITASPDTGMRDPEQATSGMLGGLASAVEKVLSGFFSFFEPAAPKPTPEQAKEQQRQASDEAERSAAFRAYVDEQERARDAIIEEARKQRHQREQDFSSRYGSPDRDADRDDDHDRGRERERER